tara:strand:+ start:280 stop:465 length:186 start_codon:yes stop_codon:yes gene_type:complete
MAKKELSIKLVKSLIGTTSHQRKSVRGLGLSRLGQEVSVVDTVENRGMIKKASHLLEINNK